MVVGHRQDKNHFATIVSKAISSLNCTHLVTTISLSFRERERQETFYTCTDIESVHVKN